MVVGRHVPLRHASAATDSATYIIKTMNIMTDLCVGAIMASALGFAAPGALAQTPAPNPDARFLEFPAYDGTDLGLTIAGDDARFRLWSPEAEHVRLRIYDNGTGGEPVQTVDMTRAESGTWTATVTPVPMGKFYTFQILHNGRWLDETPGIWPKAVGINGARAAIIDMAATNPEGWGTDSGPKLESVTDAVVYELHHRDFSVHPSSGVTNKGKFLAITEQGTVSPEGEKTGIDHLKELGVTHVQILPSYDYNSVDETGNSPRKYNWGYDPQNYNAPEGSYSTDAADPAARIREMKQMIKALHDAGIGVIMDVVYNHTAVNDGSNFSLTAPGYFYRHRADGTYSDASGCGNETASERRQMQDFIVNSVKYWAQEYHIDGFRFDLMAIHDTETMNRVARELRAINPDIIIYGEGWTAGDSPLPAERRSLKENVSALQGVGVFSDDIRDAVKGHYSNAEDKGFATGKPGNEETVKIGIVGATAHPQVDYKKGNNSKFSYAKTPASVVNYVSCHDDLMLTDKLRKSMPEATEAERQRAARLAQTIVMTSQGIPFMWAGEEFFRDKKGVHNSFESPDSINAIDWSLKHANREQFDYYKELIALRKTHPAFRMTDPEMIVECLRFDPVTIPNVISYSLRANANSDYWKEIKLVFNGSDNDVEVMIPRNEWTVIAYDGKINHNGLLDADGVPVTTKGGKTTIPHRSAYILAR